MSISVDYFWEPSYYPCVCYKVDSHCSYIFRSVLDLRPSNQYDDAGTHSGCAASSPWQPE